MLAFSIFITYALACYVAIDICWNEYLAKRFSQKSSFFEYATRTFLVTITCKHLINIFNKILILKSTVLLAVAIPNLELFISLFGALCLSALGLAFPALIETCTFWNTTKGFEKGLMVVKNTIIFLFAVVGLVSGTSVSINEIIHTFFAWLCSILRIKRTGLGPLLSHQLFTYPISLNVVLLFEFRSIGMVT